MGLQRHGRKVLSENERAAAEWKLWGRSSDAPTLRDDWEDSPSKSPVTEFTKLRCPELW